MFVPGNLIWALCIFLANLSFSTAVHDVLRITEDTVPIACRTRFSALVNGSTPGPAIHLKENQTTWVRVYNDMESSNFTMHWHGLMDATAPWSDGTPQVSQWPIKAKHYFDYELRPSIGEAGSYFYHSHVDFQVSTAAGPLIVQDADGIPPYEYDEERIIFFSELFNVTDETALEWLTNKTLSWPGEAESILVNGKGYLGLNGSQAEASTPYGEWDPTVARPCSPAIIKVEPEKKYRFRAIGGVALSPMAFALQDHDNLTVISIDGAYTNPATTSVIEMAGGQRYDFLLETKSREWLERQGKTSFWIQIETRYRAINSTFYAILSYEDTHLPLNTTVPTSPPAKKPVHIPYALEDWVEYTFEPLYDNHFPSSDKVTREVYINSTQIQSPVGTFWTLNNHTWTELDEHEKGSSPLDTHLTANPPYLVNIYLHGEQAIPDYNTAVHDHGGRDPKLNVYAAKVGEIIDIIFINEPNGLAGGFDAHPFHIHGSHIWDLGSGPGMYNATENETKLKGYRPITRDTSLLYKYTNGDDAGLGVENTAQGWRAWRLRVDNPGVWMIHCHNVFHMIMGMQSIWVMGNATEITRDVGPALVEGYLDFGGNAYGNDSFDPLVNHYFDS
ncbi:putative multi-copper oxidase [Aspergillus sclerotiicarbonarius CBS 121057]|uniref:Putative multi-copper oxidase n=1 Tax=Aspergillus sclerotiicarbonarius (strain CBS 121057 / IBT 28362) TaxID=1448318 RepID=A0A319DT59_ASPSB|nr:putative multi-copper oxidase [Aspergillus sclerotiicarbonarius CBS 121057]